MLGNLPSIKKNNIRKKTARNLDVTITLNCEKKSENAWSRERKGFRCTTMNQKQIKRVDRQSVL
jgi:hypothetical protein